MRRAAPLGATLAIAAVALPCSASAATGDSVVIYSEPGDPVGAGENRFFHSGNAGINVQRFEEEVVVYVSGGNLGGDFRLAFKPPWGQRLAPGVYDKADAQGSPTRAAIKLSGAKGCNRVAGRFEVKDVAFGSDGAVQRLWIVYEHHCELGVPAAFGEVRIGVPPPGDSWAFTAPEIVRWPLIDLGRAGPVVPVTAIVTEPARLGSASVAGDHAADFPIRVDECTGKSLGAGGQCSVWVGFTPRAAGTRVATLRIPDATGRTQEVSLQGFAYGGRTRLVMDSDPGDGIGEGGSYSYTPANAVINVWGTRANVGFHVNAASGKYWWGSFSPAEGGAIAPGRYTGATRDSTSRTGPGIEVTGNGFGCNTIKGEFTVHEATFDEDGKLKTIALDFIQHCGDTTAALRGTWEHRAGDNTQPAPWMDGGSGSAAPAANPGPGVGGPSPPAGAPPGTPTAVWERPKSGACALERFAALPLLKGTAAADRMRGTKAAEILFAGRGNDVVRAGGGNDCVDGGHHRDALSGGTGDDYLSGASGNDRLDGGPGRDFLNCGAGRDVATVTRGDRTKSCERVIRPRSRR